jgi:hypothetical protein
VAGYHFPCERVALVREDCVSETKETKACPSDGRRDHSQTRLERPKCWLSIPMLMWMG